MQIASLFYGPIQQMITQFKEKMLGDTGLSIQPENSNL